MAFNPLKALANVPGNMRSKLSLYAKVSPQINKAIKNADKEKLRTWISSDSGFIHLARHIHTQLDKDLRESFTPEELSPILKANKRAFKKALK